MGKRQSFQQVLLGNWTAAWKSMKLEHTLTSCTHAHTHTHTHPVQNAWNVFPWLLPPPETPLQAARSTDLFVSLTLAQSVIHGWRNE